MKKIISIILSFAFILNMSAVFAIDKEECPVRLNVTRYKSEEPVTQVNKGELICVNIFMKSGFNPNIVTIPLHFNSAVVKPVEITSYDVKDVVTGVHKPGDGNPRGYIRDATTENPGKDHWSASFSELGQYPRCDIEGEYYTIMFFMMGEPVVPKVDQKIFTFTFQAIEYGDADFRMANSGSDPFGKFDGTASGGLGISYHSPGIDDPVDIHNFADAKAPLTVLDPNVTPPSQEPSPTPSITPSPTPSVSPGGSGGSSGGGDNNVSNPDKSQEPSKSPEIKVDLVDAEHKDFFPFFDAGKAKTYIRPSEKNTVTEDCYYYLEDGFIDLASSELLMSGGDTILVKMPDKLIKQDNYTVALSYKTLSLTDESIYGYLYLETPYDYYVGIKAEKILPYLSEGEEALIKFTDAKAEKGYDGITVECSINGKKIDAIDNGGLCFIYANNTANKFSTMTLNQIFKNGKTKTLPLTKSYMSYGSYGTMAQEFGTYTSVMPKAKTFTDLEDVKWAENSILSLSSFNIVNGKEEGIFSPNDLVTREEFVKMIVGMTNTYVDGATSQFTDVSKDEWYYDSVASAQSMGIAGGDTDGSFGVGENITREDLCVISFRMCELLKARYKGTTVSAGNFEDIEAISDYADEAVTRLCIAGIINGKEGNMFDPQGFATRAEAAKIIDGVRNLIINSI